MEKKKRGDEEGGRTLPPRRKGRRKEGRRGRAAKSPDGRKGKPLPTSYRREKKRSLSVVSQTAERKGEEDLCEYRKTRGVLSTDGSGGRKKRKDFSLCAEGKTHYLERSRIKEVGFLAPNGEERAKKGSAVAESGRGGVFFYPHGGG